MGLQSAHHPSHVSPFHGRKFSASKGQCNFRSAIFCNFHKCFHALKIGKSPPYLETAKVSWDIYPSPLPLEKFHLDTQPTLYTRRRTIIICEKGERKVWAGGQALPPCQKTLLQRAAQKNPFFSEFSPPSSALPRGSVFLCPGLEARPVLDRYVTALAGPSSSSSSSSPVSS